MKIDRIEELEQKEFLTENERDELRELKLKRSVKDFNTESDYYNPADYGLCLTERGWF